MNAYNSGVIQNPGGNLPTNNCILPNAAISWKQPNGFYYPPAFDSRNLYFDPSVDIRHFVIDPLWQPGGFAPNTKAAMNNYCSWQSADFNNFTDVDRQTELTDLDGSLTGLLSGAAENNFPTTSVNNDPLSDPNSTLKDPDAPSNFFNAPVITHECATSVAGPMPTTGQPPTVYTSSYEYVTTAIDPACAGKVGYCANWGQYCTSQSCYGVPLYRQFLTAPEYSAWQSNNKMYPSIRMMGQSLGQRSTLTMNHGSYYIDTTVPLDVQEAAPPQGGTQVTNPNVFVAGQSYYIYVLYAKPSLHQTYSLYIGTGLSQAGAFATVTTGIVTPWAGLPITFSPGTFNGSPDWIQSKTYNATTGVLSVTMDLGEQTSVFSTAQADSCQPASYCSVHSDGTCGCKAGSSCTEDSVCSWGTKEIDCPSAGCFGFSVTLPSTFQTATAAQPIPPPAPVLFDGTPGSGDPYFTPGNIQFYNVPESVAGKQCYYSTQPTDVAKQAPAHEHR